MLSCRIETSRRLEDRHVKLSRRLNRLKQVARIVCRERRQIRLGKPAGQDRGNSDNGSRMNGGRIPIKRRGFGQACKLRESADIDFHAVIEQGRPAEFVKHDQDDRRRMPGDDGLIGFQFCLSNGIKLGEERLRETPPVRWRRSSTTIVPSWISRRTRRRLRRPSAREAIVKYPANPDDAIHGADA